MVRTPLYCSASTAGGTGLILTQETKILPAMWCGQKKKQKTSDSAPWDTEFSLETCSPLMILMTDHQSTLLSTLFRRILISLLPIHLLTSPLPLWVAFLEKKRLLGSGSWILDLEFCWLQIAAWGSFSRKLKEPGCLRLCSTPVPSCQVP